MDVSLLSKLREKINENLVYHIFKDQDGKNRWNIICSAMAWLEVVVDAIDVKNLSRGNDNSSSRQVMNLVNYIDVMWEAIQQLHRVVIDPKTIPFENEKSVFQHNQTNATDNEYFKTIRACFSAHPINLNDTFSVDNGKERRYASWSTGIIGPGDFAVQLYSNDPSKDNIHFGIYFDEVMGFAQQRYQYLETIIQALDQCIEHYCESWRKNPINHSVSIVEELQILEEEAVQRFGEGYYSSELQELSLVFNTKVANGKNKNLVNQYRKALFDEVEEIGLNLQMMELGDLLFAVDDSCPNDCIYMMEKLSETVHDKNHYGWYSDTPFRKHLDGIVDFEKITSPKELYIVLKAGFYKINTSRKTESIDLKEI